MHLALDNHESLLQKLSGVDKAPSDLTQQAPHVYKILKLVVDSFGLVSGLPTEGSILKDLGITSLIIEGERLSGCRGNHPVIYAADINIIILQKN